MSDSTDMQKAAVEMLAKEPPKSCKATIIDFEDVKLPMYKGMFAMIIENLLSPTECQALLAAAESSCNGKWDQALVNIGMGQQALYTDIRLCDRIILDHFEIAEKLLDRIMPSLPAEIVALNNNGKTTGHGPVKRKETWRISRLNERLRFLKYTDGMYFREHCDGSYVTPDGKEISFLTVHLYLNGEPAGSKDDCKDAPSDSLPLEGGATRFFGYPGNNNYDVKPLTGRCLVFQHRNLVHSGEDIIQGTKYTMRTDVLYQKDTEN